MHPLLRFCISAALGLFVAALPASASASPTYPDLIKSDLGLPYSLGTTHCTICHASNSGGVGTVVQPFGMAMKAAGLTLENPPALQTALSTLDANKTDSDGDCVPDIEQLKQGRDPNTGEYIDGSSNPKPAPLDAGCGMPTVMSEAPAYGCGAQLAPGAASAAGALSAGILAAAMLGASRRRRRPSRR